MNTPEENLAELIYNKLVLLFATEADPDIRRTFGIALLNDYFHHTPDIEWEKRKEETVEYVLNMTVDNQMVYDTLTPEQKQCFHTNIRKAITEALTSRDTYWEERVKKEVEGMKRVPAIGRNDGKIIDYTTEQDKAHNQALDTLLDNLKQL